MSGKKVIMVTGGTGLVGQAVRKIAETEEKRPDEEWIFLSSKDGDLGYAYRTALVPASLLQACSFAVFKQISVCFCIACSGSMITSLLQVVNRLDAS